MCDDAFVGFSRGHVSALGGPLLGFGEQLREPFGKVFVSPRLRLWMNSYGGSILTS